MKSEWREATLGELCEITSSKRIFAKEYCDKGIPFYRGKEIIQKAKGEDILTELYISVQRFSEIEKRFGAPQKGDILLTAVGTLGVPYLVGDEKFYFKDGNLVWLRNFNNVLPEFVYYWLKSPGGQNAVKLHTIGSTQQALTIDALKKFKIMLPKVDQQRRIVSVISSLEKKLSINKKINANLQQQSQAIFKSWFVDFEPFDGVQPGCWEEVPFGQLVEIGKKSFNPAKEPEILLEHYSIPAYDETKYPVFELSTNIKSNKFLVDKDCFLISKLNPTTKRVWRPYCLSNHAVCSTEFIVYRAKNRAYADFLYSVVDSEPFSAFMCSHVTGTTGSRQRTTPSETLNFPLVLPTPEVIERFTEIVNPIYAKMKECMVENQKLKQLRDGLLPKLMSGELIV